jgi:uncharacterized protein YjbI with pentapeptide repeats
MADPEHLQLIKQGAAAWNSARPRRPDLSGSNLEGAVLRGVDLRGANLSGASLSGANLSGATLTKAYLIGADLTGANLIGASLIRANLRKVILSRAHLLDARLERAKLRGADLRGADLINSDLDGADLRGADLSGAELSDADLSGACLVGAHLNNANLSYAHFRDADLRNADLSNAKIGFSSFTNTDLSDVRGLDLVRHLGPSSIGIDTLYKSGGRILETFLRGCGVPDEFITFIPSLIGSRQAIEFYSCFISYSTKDEEFARRLHSRMRDKHLRVWFAPEDMKGGDKLHEQIERAIHVHDRLLLVLSEGSIQSKWVKTEIRKAHKAELEQKRRKLFPITLVDFQTLQRWECFDADHGADLAAEVREYFIPDFSNWKDHDSFETAFKRLLADLEVASTGPT